MLKKHESFYDVLKYSNYKILKCYKIALNIKAKKTNFGSIIVFLSNMICLYVVLSIVLED